MLAGHTQRGFDRLVNFSDAVVAIAITLLVLPLTELVGEVTGDPHHSAWRLISENSSAFMAYALSFTVLANYWLLHHRIFERIGDYDGVLVWLNLGWLFAIVSLPFTTELIQQFGFGSGSGLLYCANLALISFFLAAMSWRVNTHPDLQGTGYAATAMRAGKSVIYGVYFVLVGLVSLVWPDVAPWLLLGLFPLGAVLDRRSAAKAPSLS